MENTKNEKTEITLIKIEGFLPDDVVENSGPHIPLYGEIKGNPNEIVVITQLKRQVFSANVCHISDKHTEESINDSYEYVLDMPGFKKIKLSSSNCIHEQGGVKFVMACLTEKDHEPALGNWLY